MGKKTNQRTPKHYDGTQTTFQSLGGLLPNILTNVNRVYSNKPEQILAAWKGLIPPQFEWMTEAVSFVDGVLNIKVKNSTLLNILIQSEKTRLLAALRKQFPQSEIKALNFRIG